LNVSSLFWQRRFALVRCTVVVLILALFLLEGYAWLSWREGNASLPPLFGNFESVRAVLEDAPRKEAFSFAVVGDTKGGAGIFERVVEELREEPLDFAVLLGDCTGGSEAFHRHFRAECSSEYAVGFPVFYVVGNHDVDLDHGRFPVARFEEEYGPSIFSFEYQDCLFIVLRVIADPSSDRASVDFLKSFLTKDVARYRKRFVFMHIPPPVPSFDPRKTGAPEELVPLFEKLHVDVVFSGHYHGYARTEQNHTTYIISGGGGDHLVETTGRGFHHALVMGVGKDHVSEKIVAVPESLEWEDVIEKYAITEVYPWMSENRTAAITANVLLLVVLAVSIGGGRARGMLSGRSRAGTTEVK